MSKRPANILLVEDDPGHAILITRSFESRPTEMVVTVARNLVEAQTQLEKLRPELVISDLRLPDGDGIDLLPPGLEHPPFPIVIMTSQGDEEVAVEIMKRGALDYIVKSELTLQDMPRIATRALREWRHITERQRAESELKQRVAQLTLINKMSNKITSALEIDTVLLRAVQLIQETFNYHHVAIYMIEGDVLKLKAVSGSIKDFFKQGHTQSLTQGIIGWVANYDKIVLANDIREDSRYITLIPEQIDIQSELCLPITVSGKPVGTLDIQSPRLGIFSQNDVLALEILSGQIATAIENARLYQAARQELAERKQAEEAKEKLEGQLRHIQKMETIGTLTAGIAHDFNNLLTAINGFAEILQTRITPNDPNWKAVSLILDSGNRAADLVSQLLAFSRKQIIQPQILNLNTIAENMNKMLQRIIGEDIHLQIILSRDLWSLKVDKAQMEQIIVNMAVNARDAMPDGGALIIETGNVMLDEQFVENHIGSITGPHVRLTISDTGHGMSEEVQSHIFEPFFTTKQMGSGTGLGLSTVFGIVKQSEGNIWVESEEDIGTTFYIYFPVAKEVQPTRRIPPEVVSTVPSGSETILLVEDDAGVRELAHLVLKSQGYRMLEAANAKQALKFARDNPNSIDLLLTDVVMPDMNGKDLAKQLTLIQPNMKVIFMSGYINKSIERHDISATSIEFLQKPFSFKVLAGKVREILDVPPV